MEMTTLIIVGVIVLIAIITIIGILSRYRKCKSDELLVVYGKTGSHKEKLNQLSKFVLLPPNRIRRLRQLKLFKRSCKGIAEASAEMYEHIHLGQVTVYGNENTAGSFMAKTAENLNPAFELLKSIPFKKTFKEMFVEDKKDNPTEDNFEAVK